MIVLRKPIAWYLSLRVCVLRVGRTPEAVCVCASAAAARSDKSLRAVPSGRCRVRAGLALPARAAAKGRHTTPFQTRLPIGTDQSSHCLQKGAVGDRIFRICSVRSKAEFWVSFWIGLTGSIGSISESPKN